MKVLAAIVAMLGFCSLTLAQDMPLSQILIPGEGWQKVEGSFAPISSLSKVNLDATTVMIIWDVKDKPQGVLDIDGKPIEMKLPETMTNEPRICVGRDGFAYILNDDLRSLRIVKFPGLKEKIADVSLPVGMASAMAISPDRGTLLIGDGAGKHIWVFRIDSDGSLSAGEKYLTMRVLPYFAATLKEKRPEEPRSEVSAIYFDSVGRIYAATKIGVQVFDPTGRLCGVLTNPSTQPVTAMTFAGSKGDHLFIACGKDVYFRKMNATSPGKVEGGRRKAE